MPSRSLSQIVYWPTVPFICRIPNGLSRLTVGSDASSKPQQLQLTVSERKPIEVYLKEGGMSVSAGQVALFCSHEGLRSQQCYFFTALTLSSSRYHSWNICALSFLGHPELQLPPRSFFFVELKCEQLVDGTQFDRVIIVYVFTELLYSARHSNDKILPTLLFFIWAANHHLDIFTFPLFSSLCSIISLEILFSHTVFFLCGFSLTWIHNYAEFSLLITETKNTTVMRQLFRFLLPL